MSNRRKLWPHEVAKRDQALAHAAEVAAEGGLSILLDECRPGVQCCWCSCEWDWRNPGDRHARRGYVCPYMCHNEALYWATVVDDGKLIIRGQPLCSKHRDDWDKTIFEMLGVDPERVEFAEPWTDDDYLDSRQ